MTLTTLAYLLGVVAVQQLHRLPGLVELLLLTGICGFLGVRRCWFLACLVFGLLWASLFAWYSLGHRLPAQYVNTDTTIEGYISSLPEQQDNRVSFDFVVTQPDRDFPEKIRLNWYHPPAQLGGGQSWRLCVKLKPAHGRMNPGGFDYEAWLFANHFGASGYVRNKTAATLLNSSANLPQYFAGWRQAIADKLDAALPGGQQLGVLKALSIGSQNSISKTQWEIFRITGATHLIVISGSHISLIAGLVFLLVRRFWAWTGILHLSPQTVAALTAWLAALFYAGLAGYSVPSLRAIVMLTVALAAIVWQRNTASWQILMLALMAVLLYDPLAVLSVGFWLSFVAVGLLIYVSAGRLGRSHYWRETGVTQLATFVGLSPLLMAFFQQVSLISPLANCLAVPTIGILVTPLALLAILLLWIWPAAASGLLNLADLLLQGLYWLLAKMAEWPLASIHCLPPPWYALPFAGIGTLLLLAPRGFPGRYLSIFLFLPLIFVHNDKPQPGAAWLTLLDVGQGLSAVIQTSRHTLVFDTGAKFAEDADMGDAVVLPFLHWQGIEHLDTLVVSHGDNDHSGGAASLLAEMPVANILSSAREWAETDKGQYCQAGQTWEWDQVRFHMISPPAQSFSKENNNSCVLKVETDQHSFLLTADIEQIAEDWLAEEYGDQLRSEVLIAPHHGSKTSSSEAFLHLVRPRLIAIPAGYLNRFGFPHREVLARYDSLPAQWLNTADQGAISIRTDQENLQVYTERDKQRRYWMVRP